jgi:hypothetical protein
MKENFNALVNGILNDSGNINEGRLSKLLGTAALTGALSVPSLNHNTNVPAQPIKSSPLPAITQQSTPRFQAQDQIHQHREKKYAERNWKSRGLKNNNPGNIKVGGEHWEGIVGRDGNFLRFKSMEHGVRAISKLLGTYFNKYKLNTVEQIITKYAPRKDNNPTEKYINDVCEYMGVQRKQHINLNDEHTMLDILNAIIRMETGRDLPDNTVLRGIRMAGNEYLNKSPVVRN